MNAPNPAGSSSSSSRATSRPPTSSWRRQLAWGGDAIIINSLCLLLAAAALVAHGWTIAVFTPLGWAFAFTVLKVGARGEYRRGWRHGFESANRSALQRLTGATPDVEVRATVLGDPTPEPWDPHTPLDPSEFSGR